jgi:hypothetical protein
MKLSQKYNNLVVETESKLIDLINKSKKKSKHIQDLKIIPVNIFDYMELTVVNDRLIFLDSNGHHYSIYSDCDLLDIIEIVEKNS